MADVADRADPVIEHVIDDARARARFALDNPRLRPIIQVLDGVRFGICHYCESEIRPGNLFCDPDQEAPEHSCSVESEHERARKEAMGL